MITPLLLATVIGLGVHAPASNELIVLVDGKETRVTLAGVAAGSEPAREFVRCLIKKRVLRVDAKHGKAWLLDGRLVSDYVNEFVGTKTAADPCAIGRAAYTPQAPRAGASAPATTASSSQPAEAGTMRSASGKTLHVSFGAAKPMSSDNLRVPLADRQDETLRAPVLSNSMGQTDTVPTIQRPPVVGTTTIQMGTTTIPPTVGTQTYGTGTTSTIGQGGTFHPSTPGTVNPPVTKPPL
jgi:hypothetical protein